jgi:ferredoxin
LLDAAEAAGVAVATSCRVGLCGTCKSSLTAGRVDMDHKGGIRAREIAQGKVLLCCARPLTDLVIDR